MTAEKMKVASDLCEAARGLTVEEIARGLTVEEIAETLGVSRKTDYRHSIGPTGPGGRRIVHELLP
jgi:AraC-like DNA-binding protein